MRRGPSSSRLAHFTFGSHYQRVVKFKLHLKTSNPTSLSNHAKAAQKSRAASDIKNYSSISTNPHHKYLQSANDTHIRNYTFQAFTKNPNEVACPTVKACLTASPVQLWMAHNPRTRQHTSPSGSVSTLSGWGMGRGHGRKLESKF